MIDVEFGNTCIVSEKWNVSRFIPRLYEWIYKLFLSLHHFLIELWVLNQRYYQSVGSQSKVTTVGFQLEDPSSNAIDSQFLILALWNLSSDSVGAKDFSRELQH